MPQGLTFGIFSKVNSLDLIKRKASLKAIYALFALHYYADEHGRVFATQTQIAKRAGLQQSHLSTGLKELKRKGYVFHNEDEGFYWIDRALIRYS